MADAAPSTPPKSPRGDGPAATAPPPIAPKAESVPSVKSVASLPPPVGDYTTLAAAIPGATYARLEDGAGVLTVPADDFFTAASWAKSAGYRVLSLLSAYDRVDHFGVLYAFLKLAATTGQFAELRLRVVMPKAAGEPRCTSLVDLYPGAAWQEREMFDMYGIRFEGNPDLRRMFLPEDWTGYPMRKDNKEPEQYVALREGEDITVKNPQEGAW